MDADTAIMRDHEELRGLAERMADLDEDTQVLVAQLKLRLRAHTATTRSQVHPALVHEDAGCTSLTGKRDAEHRALLDNVETVEQSVDTTDFAAAASEAAHAIRTELDREETTVLPLLRKLLGPEQLGELGRRYEVRLLAEMDAQTPVPDSPPEPTG